MDEKKFNELLECVKSITGWIRFGGWMLVCAILISVLNFVLAVMNY